MEEESSSSYYSDDNHTETQITVDTNTIPRIDTLPFQEKSNFSQQTINNIFQQKAAFYKYKKNLNNAIWHDSNFVPDPLLDSISEKITEELVGDVANSLGQICDEFINCLVHSEFFPEDVPQ